MQVEERLQRIEIAMGKFTEAMQEFAQHLASHTSAVINLAESAQGLRKAAAEQNKVLSELARAVKEMNARKERR